MLRESISQPICDHSLLQDRGRWVSSNPLLENCLCHIYIWKEHRSYSRQMRTCKCTGIVFYLAMFFIYKNILNT